MHVTVVVTTVVCVLCVYYVCVCVCVCVMVYVAIGDTKVWECTGSQLRVVLCHVMLCDDVHRCSGK